jgi:hypothetical protein
MQKVLFIIYVLFIGVTSMYTQINDRHLHQYQDLVDLFKDRLCNLGPHSAWVVLQLPASP